MDSHPISPQGDSPPTSLEALIPSSQPISDAMLSSTQDTQDYLKYSSPAPPSSLTSPPSTQPPPLGRPPIPTKADVNMYNRTATPNPSAFSCPPIASAASSTRRDVSASGTYVKPSQALVAQSSRGELEAMLVGAIAEIDRLGLQARESRMSAAHSNLQHNLLSIDTEETFKRMEVEHEMTRREVGVLQLSEQFRQSQAEIEVDHEYIGKLKGYCESLNDELEIISRRLRQAKKALKRKDEDMKTLTEENGRLLRRIRENREHLSQLRSPGGIFADTTPRTYPSTPQQYRATPKHTPATNHSHARDESSEPFAALLLADQVLRGENRQENPHNSAPSTPVLARMPIKHHQVGHGHTRAAHSLSSLPTSPVRSSHASKDSVLLPSVQFVAQSEPRHRTSTEKRKRSHDAGIRAPQKISKLGEGVGLGIGGWNSPQM